MDWLSIIGIIVCTAALYSLALLGYLWLRRRTAAAEGILLVCTVALSVANYLFATSGSEDMLKFAQAAGPAYATLSAFLRAVYMTCGGIAFEGLPEDAFGPMYDVPALRCVILSIILLCGLIYLTVFAAVFAYGMYSRQRLRLSRKREFYVFATLSEEVLALADDIRRNRPSAEIVFAGSRLEPFDRSNELHRAVMERGYLYIRLPEKGKPLLDQLNLYRKAEYADIRVLSLAGGESEIGENREFYRSESIRLIGEGLHRAGLFAQNRAACPLRHLGDNSRLRAALHITFALRGRDGETDEEPEALNDAAVSETLEREQATWKDSPLLSNVCAELSALKSTLPAELPAPAAARKKAQKAFCGALRTAVVEHTAGRTGEGELPDTTMQALAVYHAALAQESDAEQAAFTVLCDCAAWMCAQPVLRPQCRLLCEAALAADALMDAAHPAAVGDIARWRGEGGDNAGQTCDFRALLLGFGDIGQQVLDRLYVNTAFTRTAADGTPLPSRFYADVFAPDADQALGVFEVGHPLVICYDQNENTSEHMTALRRRVLEDAGAGTPEECALPRVRFIRSDVGERAFFDHWARMIDEPFERYPDYIAFCYPDDRDNLNMVSAVLTAMRQSPPSGPVCLAVHLSDSGSRHLIPGADGIEGVTVVVFSGRDALCSYDTVFASARYSAARAFNFSYGKISDAIWEASEKADDFGYTYQDEATFMLDHWVDIRNALEDLDNRAIEALYSWKELTGFTRASNLAADRYRFVYRAIAGENDEASYLKRLQNDPALLHRLVFTEHLRWNAFHIAAGWVPNPAGVRKNPTLRRHPCLVPFERLEVVSEKAGTHYYTYDIGNLLLAATDLQNP